MERVKIDPQSRDSREFLETIWSLLNGEYEYQANALYDLSVYLAKVGGEYVVISPELFDREPAILAPSNALEHKICSQIPGLCLVQETTFPRTKVRDESLQSEEGLMRFTRSLSQLAFKSHQTLESYLRKILSDSDLAVLRQCYVAVLSNIGTTTKYSQSLSTMLRQLPLWENVNGQLIAAMNGAILPHPQLFLPWLDVCEKLLVPVADSSFKRALSFLGLRTLDPTAFIQRYLIQDIRQHKICQEEVDQYCSFLAVVLQLIPVMPTEWPLACDGSLRFRKIDELYDHRNPFFKASFRGSEGDKFLHAKVRKFWDEDSGLKTGVTAQDYVTAAKQIQLRGLLDNGWKENLDTQLQADARTVYQTLCLGWGDTGNNEPTLVERLSRICFIPTRRRFTQQPRFRMIRMQSLANRRPFNCFQELVLLEHVDICWSQVRFH